MVQIIWNQKWASPIEMPPTKQRLARLSRKSQSLWVKDPNDQDSWSKFAIDVPRKHREGKKTNRNSSRQESVHLQSLIKEAYKLQSEVLKPLNYSSLKGNFLRFEEKNAQHEVLTTAKKIPER